MKLERGFTLLEVVVALFIFSIGIMAISSLQITSRRLLSSTTQNLNNSNSVTALLEHVIGLDYHDPRLKDMDDGFMPDTPDYGPEPIANSRSTIELEVDDDFPVQHSKRILVTIRHIDRGGGERTMLYHYIKCREYI